MQRGQSLQYPPPNRGPPPPQRRSQAIVNRPETADPRLWGFFQTVDRDKSGFIDAVELQSALLNGDRTRFDLDTVKMLMGLFDTDRSGTINFNEFCGLYKYIDDWQKVFGHWDSNRSGSIDRQEFEGALKSFGYNLSPVIMNMIMDKYSSAPAIAGWGAPAPTVSFDRFVRACVVIKSLTESFQALDTDRDGWIQIHYEDFMKLFLLAP